MYKKGAIDSDCSIFETVNEGGDIFGDIYKDEAFNNDVSIYQPDDERENIVGNVAQVKPPSPKMGFS